MAYPQFYIAQATGNYNCDSYGSGDFGTCGNTSTAGGTTTGSGTTGGSGGGALANTGYDIIIPLALAGAIIIASLIYCIRRFKARHAHAD